MPNQPSPRKSLFQNYTSEQVPMIPAGYMEAAQAQASMYANMGQQVAKMVGDSEANKIKAAEVAQLERKNNLYERNLDDKDAVSMVGEVEKISALHQKSLDAIDGELGTLDKQLRGEKLNDLDRKGIEDKMAKLREQRGSIAGRMHELSQRAFDYVTNRPRGSKGAPAPAPSGGNDIIQPQGVTPLPNGTIREAKPGEGVNMLDMPVDIMNTPAKPRVDYRGFTPTNYLTANNPLGSGGTGVVSTFTTNRMGGAPKKVVVQDGRVHSVVDSSGRATQINGFIPEQSISAVEEYANATNSEQPVDASNTENPHQFPETPDVALTEQAMPAPLKGSMYRIPVEGLEADPKSGNADGRVHATIEFKDGRPRMLFNWDLLDEAKVGKVGVESTRKSQRMLSMMNWILMNGQEQEVEVVTPEEFSQARRLFQTKNNGNEMYRIAQAYALASRDTGNVDTPEANRFGLRFHDEFNMYPTEFLVKGEVDNEIMITPSAKILNEENVNGVLGKVREAEGELATVSTRPSDLEKDDPAIPKIRKLKEKRDFAMDTFNGPGNKKQKDEALKEIKAIDDELKFYEAESRSYQSRIQQWQDSIKAAQAKIEAAKGPITTQKTLTEIEANEQHAASVATKTIKNFFPASGKEIMKYGGWLPSKYNDIRGYTSTLTDPLGQRYKWNLSPAETVDMLWKNGKWKDIERIGGMLPTPEQWSAIDTAHRSAIGAIVPLAKLKKENEGLLETWRGRGGVPQTQFKKLTSTELAEAETMRAAIIKDIRVALVGPGNPSNYEQEILRSIVPDPKEFFSSPERNKVRLKALTLLVILNHAANMRYNGMGKPDASVYKWYTENYGDVLGETIDATTFNNIYEDYSRAATMYKSNEARGRDTHSAAQFGENLLKRLEEAEIAKTKAK